ncbi:hypothetical protein [Cellulomonas sp. NS3]|nr:hypothetical protein [Cellulomonas sp. NS3]
MVRRVRDADGQVVAVVIAYRDQDGGLVSEVLELEDGLVVRGHGTYLV